MRFVFVFIMFLAILSPLWGEDCFYYNKEGLMYLERNEPEKALQFFILALKADETNKYFNNNAAVSLMRLRRYQEAVFYLKKAIAADPDYEKALCNMAVAYFHLKDYPEAYMYYLKAMKADERYTKMRFEKMKIKAYLQSLKQRALKYLD